MTRRGLRITSEDEPGKFTFGSIMSFGVLVYAISQYDSGDNTRGYTVVGIVVVSLLLFFFVLLVVRSRNYILTESNILETSLFGQEKVFCELDQLDYFTESEGKNKSIKMEVVLKNDKRKILISSLANMQYDAIKDELSKYAPHNLEIQEQKRSRFERKYMWIAFPVGLLFFYFAYAIFESDALKPSDIVELRGVTSTKVVYAGGKSPSMRFRLQHYPKFEFHISSDALAATLGKSLRSDIEPGDSLLVGIQADGFAKIRNADADTFENRYFFNDVISVATLKSPVREYLTLSNLNAERTEPRYFQCGLLILFGLMLISPMLKNLDND